MVKDGIKSLLARFGWELRRKPPLIREYPVELGQPIRDTILRIRREGLTMGSNERLFATAMACQYVVDQGIPGDFVECGVWKGGNSILAATIYEAAATDRKVWLYDTFAGMTEPTAFDVNVVNNNPARDSYDQYKTDEGSSWCFAGIDMVKEGLHSFAVPERRYRLIEGDVCETLQQEANLPARIAVLRLDTDWYESTIKELEVLYPRLESGGILLVDDYGHWGGARKAVDDYFGRAGTKPFLSYTDWTARLMVKP